MAAPKKPFRFKNKLYRLDACVMDLCLSMYDWAKFRRTKGAVKLHLRLDHDGCLLSYAVIIEGKTHEIRMARALQLPAGAIVAMDRGYVDYLFLDSLTEQGVFFVTRLKDNAVFSFAGQGSAPREDILADEWIDLPGSGKSHNPQRQLRRVVVWDEVAGQQIVLLTNNRKLSAVTIAAIYKQRWQIELFFKALKLSRFHRSKQRKQGQADGRRAWIASCPRGAGGGGAEQGCQVPYRIDRATPG